MIFFKKDSNINHYSLYGIGNAVSVMHSVTTFVCN